MTPTDKLFELAKTIEVALSEYEVQRKLMENEGITIFIPVQELVHRCIGSPLTGIRTPDFSQFRPL